MRDASNTPRTTKKATLSPASAPADTSRPGLSNQFEKLTEATANRAGSSRRQGGQPTPRTIGARAISIPQAIRAVRTSEMNGAPNTSTTQDRSSESGPDRPASPAKRPAGAAIVDNAPGGPCSTTVSTIRP